MSHPMIVLLPDPLGAEKMSSFPFFCFFMMPVNLPVSFGVADGIDVSDAIRGR